MRRKKITRDGRERFKMKQKTVVIENKKEEEMQEKQKHME